MTNKYAMQIMAVEADKLPPQINDVTGCHLLEPVEVEKALNQAGVWWGIRGVLETDKRFRQIIPYIVVRKGDKIATYVRGSSGGEERLHGKMAVGIGGHIDMLDNWCGIDYQTDPYMTVVRAANREFTEEVTLRGWTDQQFKLKGFIVDNSDDVGQVHIGVLVELTVPETCEIASNEPDLADIQFYTREELLAQADRLERWTALYLGSLPTENA